MGRKSITKIGQEIGISPGQVSLLAAKLKEWCLLHPDNRVEIQGLGVFKGTQQQERWWINGNTVYSSAARDVVTMRAPRRKQTFKFIETTNRWLDLQFDNWPDENNPAKFRVRDGALLGTQPLIPGTSISRNISFTNVGSNAVDMQYSYQDITAGPTQSRVDTIRLTRIGSSIQIGSSNPFQTNQAITSLAITGSLFAPFAPWSWTRMEDWKNPYLGSAEKAMARYAMMILRGEQWPVITN